ncbi:MAG TPA: thiosulfohydrolase SoxB, partial [Aurantimonas sp.]
MFSRREFLTATVALAALTGSGLSGRWSRAAAQQLMSEDDLLAAPDFGNLTLFHITDIHAQLKPVFFREPAVNIGIGEVAGLPPHVTGADFLKLYNIEPGTPEAYALTSEDYAALASQYG